jgi:hypothetical protein
MYFLEYFTDIWDILFPLGTFLCSFGTIFPVLVTCAKKNLATLSSKPISIVHNVGSTFLSSCSSSLAIVQTLQNSFKSDLQEGDRGFESMYKQTRDRCYEFKNIFAEKFSEKIGVFYSKQS